MKKIYAIIAAALLAVPSFADEGMWLLPLIEKMNAKAIYSLGGRLSPEEIYSINHSSIKDAIVQFGRGCTGEIISDEGLLVTNHHCGYGSIQGLSSPEHNYLEDGFWAMSREEELPVPGLTVRFLQSMTDVTPKLAKQSREEIAEQAKQANPGCDVQVVDFYNSNVAYLIISKIYRDVRFVGAPPASMGKFGGETDNWMWPRHTCDFSMFRVYAGKDNEPADYSKDNVPMHPRQSLKVSLKGVEEGDFAMIMGYPGRTQRFQTASQLEMMMAVNAIRIDARTARQEVMWEAMMADPVVRLQYASKYASSANGWKKWQGMRDSFAKLDIIGRENAKEQEFMSWVGKKAKRQKAYGSALEVIETAVQEELEANKAITLLSESIGQIEAVSFAGAMIRSVTQMMALPKDDPEFESKGKTFLESSKRMVSAQFKNYNEELDRKEAATLIRFYCERVKPEDVISYKDKKLTEYDPEVLAAEIFDNTRLTSAEKLATVNSPVDIIKDPAVVLAGMITDGYRKFVKPIRDNEAVIADASKSFTAGLLEWKKGEPSYPDANSTCRLTYGNVKSYSPKDGVLYRHYTTLKGVMEKEDPSNYEFRVPAKLKEIYNNKDYGQYANAAGELPTCFLTNLDITGGNSGSPVLDADGNLIGLAFDGNWEAMSSDVMFEPQLQRCICVDIRYVLLMMDKFGGAGYLLDEMKIVR
ncbi:MAG: S46 family peptidase [Bacteroidales bacterium]|nr:S46 family peptidase [Candidatus Cryptobacteroides equifaecalis]